MEKTRTLQRMTRQRKILMQLLNRKNWHPTAEEIHDILREQAPNISLGTVYRNLDILSRDGVIQTLETGGVQRHYDGNGEPHSHAQCRQCNEIWDVEFQLAAWPLPKIMGCPGFTVTGYKLVFEGICQMCQQGENREKE